MFYCQNIIIQMNKQQDNVQINNKKREFMFKVRDKSVCFSGNFDSGNLQNVQQLTPYIYRITAGFDQTRHSSKKSIFHFKVSGLAQCNITFLINKIYLLQQFIAIDNLSNIYHPVFKIQSQTSYKKIKDNVKLYYNMSAEPQMSFNYAFSKEQQTYFAFTYPYSYQDGQNFVKEISIKYLNHPEIKFNNSILCIINNKFNVNVIKISSRDSVQAHQSDQSKRSTMIEKPKVLITARVHPGQSPSSFCVQGIIRYLLNEQDYRAYLLRKHFEFIIVPMLNPQAVYNGYFRSDVNGYNLNRVYYCADQLLHTSIWSLKNYTDNIKNIDFYFDLHGHSGLKDFFIYGNAFKELEYQVEAQVFGKIIEFNCPYFQNLNCIFTQSAMKSKDKYDKLTKQGCGRVYFHKIFKIIHSYTVECGYFYPTKLNSYPYKPRQLKLTHNNYKQTRDWQQTSKNQYKTQNYMFLGKSLLNSILDLFHLNPYAKIQSKSSIYSIENLRILTAQKIFSEYDRFNLNDENAMRKMRNEPNLIQKRYYEKRFGYCGLSIKDKMLPSFNLSKQTFPYSISQRKNKEEQQNPVANVIKSQIFLSDSSSNKQRLNLPSMKYLFFTQQKSKQQSNNNELSIQMHNKQQTIIGRIHEQIFKQFAIYNKSKQSIKKNKKRLQTQSMPIKNKAQTQLLPIHKLTMNDFNFKKQSKYHLSSQLNIKNIKKQVLLHVLNKRSARGQRNCTLTKSNNFRVINGKQILRTSMKKMEGERLYKGSLKKISFKI